MPVQESQIYKRIRLLGEGSYGKAYLVESVQDHSLLVVKQMDLRFMSEDEKQEAYKEARILAQLKHPNIINFREVYKTKKGRLCIVMDYADGGDLCQRIKSFGSEPIPESQILDWFTQLCLAVKHVHDRKTIHRDIKTQNIFLTKDGRVKMGDFGIAKVLNNTRDKAKTFVGTPYYLAPELIENKGYSFQSDMWSLGVVLYELCARTQPFDADNLPLLALKIVSGQYNPIPSHYSKELRNIVQLLLNVNEQGRPSAHQILRMPIIMNRIKNFLSETIRQREFAHTVLHNHNILASPKFQMKLIDDEEPKKKVNKKPATPAAHLPELKNPPRVATPNGRKPEQQQNQRKLSGEEHSSNSKGVVRLPEIKGPPQKPYDVRPPITRQASRPLNLAKQCPQTPMENAKKRWKISEIASSKQKLITKDSMEDLDRISGKHSSPTENNNKDGLFEDEVLEQQQGVGLVKQRGHSAFKQKQQKSPSVSEPLKPLKKRAMLSDGENNGTPLHQPVQRESRSSKIRIHINAHQMVEKIFKVKPVDAIRRRNTESNRSATSIESLALNKEEPPLELTLHKISEQPSEKVSPVKNSSTIKSVYQNTTPEHTHQITDNDFNYSMSKSQICENTVKKFAPETTHSQEGAPDEKHEKKRKIIFKDPFSRKNIIKPFIKRVDSEEDLRTMLEELLIDPEKQPEQHNHHNVDQDDSLTSMEVGSEEEEQEQQHPVKKVPELEEHALQTLDYISGNKQIQHLRDQLVHKLKHHFTEIYHYAKGLPDQADVATKLVARKLKDLLPNSEQKAVNTVATLVVTLVVLSKGEML